VPKPGGREGELQDRWIDYLYREFPEVSVDPVANAEQEFPFRNKQVSALQRSTERSRVKLECRVQRTFYDGGLCR
jgi:hypothetical protein